MTRSKLTARDLADQVVFRVSGKDVRAPRRLWDLMAGPVPPPEFESNGAGPKRSKLLSWLIPDTLHNWSFVLPAHYHDHFYALGKRAGTQRQADWNLARNIVTAISEGGGSCSAPRIFGIALLYWLGVRSGGWVAFKRRSIGAPPPAGKLATALEAPVVVARLLWAVVT